MEPTSTHSAACGPIYGLQTATGRLLDIAERIEDGIMVIDVGPEDAKAIRWALKCQYALRIMKRWNLNDRITKFICDTLGDCTEEKKKETEH